MFETILVVYDKGVALITLNRPDAFNALDDLMREEIRLAMEDIAVNDEVNVVIITGAGRAFCAGGDVNAQAKGFDAITGRARLQNLHRLLNVMVNMNKPIIAAVNGVAVGAGCNLALASDIIIASEKAKFSQIFINLGFVPDFGGMYFLPRQVGLHKAKELVFTGRFVEAQEAKEIGLVNKIVPPDELMDVVWELASEIAKRSPKAIGLGKALMNRSINCDLSTLLDLEAFAQGICFQSDEHKQLLKEFRERKTK